MPNIVYIATSLDGYIADRDGGLDWLQYVPNPEQDDFGFAAFMDSIDALVMGRKTFEAVCGFDCPWPYNKPVFVVSDSLATIPPEYKNKVCLISGSPSNIVASLNGQGFKNLYIDGGQNIQRFLKEDLVDEMVITTIPVLLGGGTLLFGELAEPLAFDLIESTVLLNAMVKNCYQRRR